MSLSSDQSGLIAVIILNFRSAPLVHECIASFQRHSTSDTRFAYIVVDASCDPEQTQLLRIGASACGFEPVEIDEQRFESAPNSRFILCTLSANVGYSRGNNVGIRIADAIGSTEFIVANPDVELLDASTVPALLAALRVNRRVVCAFPSVQGSDGKLTGSNQGPYRRESNLKLLIGPKLFEPVDNALYELRQRVSKWRFRSVGAHRIYTSLGCFFAANTRNFVAAGMFDESFFLYCEEAVLGARARRARLLILFVPRARILHKHDYSRSLINMPMYFESTHRYHFKYLGRTPRFMAIVEKRNAITARIRNVFKSR